MNLGSVLRRAQGNKQHDQSPFYSSIFPCRIVDRTFIISVPCQLLSVSVISNLFESLESRRLPFVPLWEFVGLVLVCFYLFRQSVGLRHKVTAENEILLGFTL